MGIISSSPVHGRMQQRLNSPWRCTSCSCTSWVAVAHLQRGTMQHGGMSPKASSLCHLPSTPPPRFFGSTASIAEDGNRVSPTARSQSVPGRLWCAKQMIVHRLARIPGHLPLVMVLCRSFGQPPCPLGLACAHAALRRRPQHGTAATRPLGFRVTFLTLLFQMHL